MNCNDQRILNVCKEMLYFLKSDKDEELIHGKEVRKISRDKSCFTEISLGFCSFRMIYTPLSQVSTESFKGSDEGALVILSLPFAELGASSNSAKLEIRCYYSERGSNARLVANVPDAYKTASYGTKRVTVTYKTTETDPLS